MFNGKMGTPANMFNGNLLKSEKSTGIATVHCIDLRGSKNGFRAIPNATNTLPIKTLNPKHCVLYIYISFLYWAYHI